MSATTIQTLVLGLAAIAAAGLGVFLVQAHRLFAVIAYLGALMLVPAWLVISFGVDLAPTTLVGLAIVVGLFGVDSARPAMFDIALLGFGALTMFMSLNGMIDSNQLFQVTFWWILPYFVARTLASRGQLLNVYDVVAVLVLVVAVLALIESATNRNLFDELLGGYGRGSQWSSLQWRGGRVRVEGAFGHSIALGGTLAMTVPMIWVSRWRTSYKVTTLAAVGAAAFLTFSRIGILSTAFALVLSMIFLRGSMTRRVRWMIAIAGLVAAAVFVPTLLDVFAAAGTEAERSADFRLFLLQLVPVMAVMGEATSAAVQLRSIDSQIIVVGVHFGIVPLVFLLGCALVAVVMLIRRPNPGLVAVVAILPALTSVSFITQFTAFIWFSVGLAVSELVQDSAVPARFEGSIVGGRGAPKVVTAGR